MMQNQLVDEVEMGVGICQFLNEGIGCSCLFKQRFSDFVVNEVTPDQKVVVLSNRNLWKEFADVRRSHEQYISQGQQKDDRNPFADFSLSEEFQKESEILIGQQATDKILKYIVDVKENCNRSNFQIKVALPSEKQQRMAIHTLIRTHLPFMETITRNQNNLKKLQKEIKAETKLTGEVNDLDEFILIKVHLVEFKRYKSDRMFGILTNEKPKSFLRFTLMKRNMDTINVGILLSKYLSISNKHFQMAGIKDKRGVTTQRCSLQGITIGQLEEIQTRKNWNQNIVLADYEYSDSPVGLGDLYGNRFLATLRLTSNWDQQALANNIENLHQSGFINYFGLQRFGVNSKVKTYEIGRELVRQNWGEAFKGVMRSVCSDDELLRQALEQYLEDWDHKRMLRALPVKLRLERMLITGLQTYGNNNYLSAFMSLPRSAREIYIHSFQSYIWNQMASYRIQMYGNQVVEGDLVKEDDINDEDVEGNDLLKEGVEGVDNADLIDKEIEVVKQEQITLVTSQNIKQYTLNQVVIPLFGSKTIIPEESIYNNIFESSLMKEGVTKIDFIRLQQQFLINGRYRKFICTPENLTHEIVSYRDKEQDLISPFDSDQLKIETGNLKALILRFTLKKSAYATMLIREVLKQSSSLEMQQQLAIQYNAL